MAKSAHTLPDTTVSVVRGTFHDRESVIRAVERLAEKSVPADSIRVFVEEASGGRREVPVEDESGALRGALWGAGVGAVAGVGIVVAAAAGLLGPPGVGVLSMQGISGALRTIAGAAAAAVPLGALLGLGHWRGRKKISPDDFESGMATVEVRTSALSGLVRQVLEEGGAERVVEEGSD